ncbi:MAG: hypothetical protein EAZ88_23560, partial [Oscillatoriales cyanobacterium]
MTGDCTNLSQHRRCRRCTDLLANFHPGKLKNFVRVNSYEFWSKLLMVFNGSTIDKSLSTKQRTCLGFWGIMESTQSTLG